MNENTRNVLISQLKAEIQNHADLTNMNDEQFHTLAKKVLEDKVEWARINSPEAYYELSSLNFREKKYVTDAVFESIRGLGVLGQIISDSDVAKM